MSDASVANTHLQFRKFEALETDTPQISVSLAPLFVGRGKIMKSLVGYEWPEGHSKQVPYISQDHHIHEFFVGV